MAREIEIKGTIISNDSKWLYDLFEMSSTCPRDVIEPLKEIHGTEDIIILMNSPGGNCDAADEIYTAISTYQGNIEIHVVGVAYSAASEILMACKSYISPVGKVMIHNASTSASGDYREMDLTSDMLRKYNLAIQNAYKAKIDNSGKQPISYAELTELMDKTTFMTAQEAVDKGFVDEILKTNSSNVTTVYNAEFPILNEDKIRELSALLMKSTKTDNTNPKTKVEDFINNKEENKGGTNVTIDELREKHPELSAELDAMVSNAKEEGVQEERERMRSIDEISNTIPESMVNDAKYSTPCNAAELALIVAQEAVKQGKAYFDNAITDSEKSGVNAVKPEVKDLSGGEKEDNDMELAEIVAASANRGRGKKE